LQADRRTPASAVRRGAFDFFQRRVAERVAVSDTGWIVTATKSIQER
jgi:hypothetical protein